MSGSGTGMWRPRCTASGVVCDWTDDLEAAHASPHHPQGTLRPHIVWFGEMPLGMNRIERALADWEQAGVHAEGVPELLRRAPVLARLHGVLAV